MTYIELALLGVLILTIIVASRAIWRSAWTVGTGFEFKEEEPEEVPFYSSSNMPLYFGSRGHLL